MKMKIHGMCVRKALLGFAITGFALAFGLAPNKVVAANVNYIGVSGGEWATGTNWSSATYPTSSDIAFLDSTANFSVAAPNNIQGIRIGTGGDGRLQIGSQASLTATANATVTSIVGSGSGNQGYVQQEGGIIDINRLEIGSGSASGTYHLHSGSLTVIRESGGHSLFLARNGTGDGTFRISSGTFTTRAGVQLGSTAGGIGRFEVIGSHPGSIGIGSSGSLDGKWTHNAGSILSVRIDKTTQGVTPVFIDDSDNNGSGGDAVFESGALLEVDFTAAFLNGGTFTVMEWEGAVTDNGLQFAPSVDTNIWSFQVDAANKRLTVTAAGSPLSRTFVHPGLSHKLADLDRMRDMVAAGAEPYASTFAALSADSQAQHTYQPSSAADDLATNGGQANNNALRNDGVAAYYNALMWYITGDSRHAEASIRIFTAWSGVKNIPGIPLNAGRHWRLIEAAEIIKHTYSGWDPVDRQAFEDMLVYPGYSNTTPPTGSDQSIYWRAHQGDPARHGNQGLFAMRCVMAIGVFLDNEIMYDRALRYLQGAPARTDDIPYVTGPSIADTQIGTYEHFLEYSRTGEETTIADYGYNEVVHNYIYPNGQSQEFSRDMAHALAGIGIIATMSEIAWSQGDDLYGHLDNRPLLGLEYYYRYNISFVNSFPDQTTPWEPAVETGEYVQRRDQSGRWFALKPNPYLAQNVGPEFLKRGTFNDDPMYEMNLAHYRDRIGVSSDDTKWLERGLDLLIAEQGFEGEGTPWDHPSWGGLTFRRVSPGDPIQGFVGDTPDFAMNSLPMTIEAENYDYFPLDGEGRTYHDLSPGNSGQSYRPVDGVDLSPAASGGSAISSIEAGEWVTYTVSAPVTGTYEISINYASTAPGGTIQFSFAGVDATGAVSVPHGSPGSTGASDWKDLVVSTNVYLSQGVQQLRVDFGGASEVFLLNSITISQLSESLVVYEHTAGSTSPDVVASGLSSSASLGGNLNGTIANTIDQLSAASANNLPLSIPVTDFTHYFSYEIFSNGNTVEYQNLSLDAYAKDANRRYQLSYLIAGQSEVFITSGPVEPGDVNDVGNFDVYDFPNFTTASDVEFRVYWQGDASDTSNARVYVDELSLIGLVSGNEELGLVAHWSLDDGSGTTVTDVGGNGFDATLANAAWVSGVNGSALDFDGASSTVTLPATAFATVNDQVSISMWVHGGAGQPQNNSAFYAVDASNNRVLNVHLPWSNGSVYWDAGFSGGYDRIYKGAAVNEYKGQWNHWVFTKNAATGDMAIYLNGNLWHSGTGKTRMMSGITAAALGSQISGVHYDGLIDDVQLYDVSLTATEVSDLFTGYTVTNNVPAHWLMSYGIEPTDAGALADTDGDGLANWEEYAQGKNPTVNDSSPDIRVTEYYLTTGDFTGTTTTITLGQDLANDYYILVRGSRTGDGSSNPNNDYARVLSVPGGRGDLAASGANNLIGLQRQAADFDWEGVVTVVECQNSASAGGFKLVDAVVTAMTTTSGTATSAAWTDINQVVLFGGYRGGGVEMFGNPSNRKEGTGCYTRLHPSGSGMINWSRDAGGETMHDATMTTFVVEWGSEWTIQHVNVAGNNGGGGADATGEYTTAAINSVVRANTWVWGTGTRIDSGIGDSAEACLITLGDGVNQNANETLVAVGSEYTDAYDFDVYVMTHSGLQVDHRFKLDGDSTGLDVGVAVNSAPAGTRFGWVYNGCHGTGTAFPRPRLWSRYTSDTTVTVSRGYDGQPFPAWVQGINFSGLNN